MNGKSAKKKKTRTEREGATFTLVQIEKRRRKSSPLKKKLKTSRGECFWREGILKGKWRGEGNRFRCFRSGKGSCGSGGD